MIVNDVKAGNQIHLGDRIRGIADQLKQETHIQIKATSRILGAAAQISENHDRLINEVSDMVQEDLDQASALVSMEPITTEQLKQQFKTLVQAKTYFDVKASSWVALTEKVNAKTEQPLPSLEKSSVSQRLEAIDIDLKTLRTDLNQVMSMLAVIAEKVS